MTATTTIDEQAAKAIRRQAARELCVRSFRAFVEALWPVLEPGTKLRPGWHLDLICRELEAVARRDVRELVICIPPGKAKSLLVSVLWPAWQWLSRPDERFLCIANEGDLASRDSRRMRDVVLSPQYRALQQHQADLGRVPLFLDRRTRKKRLWSMLSDQNEKVNFANDYQGFRQCKGIGEKVTGKRGSVLIIDDPYDAKEVVLGSPAQTARRMLDVVATYDNVLSSRLNEDERSVKVVIQQRLHPDDLAGVLIARGVRAVVLPEEYDPARTDNHPDDPRTQPGQLIEDTDEARARLAERKERMLSRHFEAQYNQRPSRAEGSTFRLSWVQYHAFDASTALIDDLILSVDATFKGGSSSDYVALEVWGKRGNNYYLLDCVRRQMSYVETRAAIRLLVEKHPRIGKVVIEEAANGAALIDDLGGSLGVPVVGWKPTVSKEARAELAAVAWEQMRVWLPDSKRCPWVVDFVAEHLAFPGGTNDDMVDAGTQAVLWWEGTKAAPKVVTAKAATNALRKVFG